MNGLRRITDGVLFQAVLTGSLSFSHIHDLAAAHGQAGWKAWLYPLSVDLLTVAAYRRLMAARRTGPTGLAWSSFLLGLAASLAANIAGAWQNPDRLVAVALGVWPAVAFLVCTLLSHDPTPAGVPDQSVIVPAPVPAEVPPAPVPVPDPPTVEVPEPEAAPVTPEPVREPVRVTPTPPRLGVTQTVPWADDRLRAAAREVNAAALAESGRPAGVTRLRTELRIGQSRAQELRDYLRALPEPITHANGHAVIGTAG